MRIRLTLILFVLSFGKEALAQAPGNNLFMQYYAGKNFDQRTFLMDKILFTNDLSKDFIFHSSYFLHDVAGSMDITNPAHFFKENMSLLSAGYFRDDKSCFEASTSSLAEKKLRANAHFRFTAGSWSFKGYASGSLYKQNNSVEKKGSDFLCMQKRELIHERAGLLISHNWGGGGFSLDADVYNYSGKNYFGKIAPKDKFMPDFKPDNADEVYNLRQNRSLFGGRFQFSLRTKNSRSLFDVISNIKHYEDSTRNGFQFYTAQQDIIYTGLQHVWKIKYMNIIAGVSGLQDVATEKLNGSEIKRNLFVPGFYTLYEFSKKDNHKFTAQSSLDFHPVFGTMFQPSLRMDFIPQVDFAAYRALEFGIFYNRGQRTVNVLQENSKFISGNRTIFLPLNLMQESYHKSGLAMDYSSRDRRFKAKFVYHFDYFNKYVFADPGERGTELKFNLLTNSFKKQVFESSFYFNFFNGSYVNFKMRNNIFYLYTEKGRTGLYYTPKTDFMVQSLIHFFRFNGNNHNTNNFLDLQINQYFAAKQTVLAKLGSLYTWQNKKFYQLDLDFVFRSDGRSRHMDKKNKEVTYRSIDCRVSLVNVTSFIQKDVFIQPGSVNDFSGMQTWANYNPTRVSLSVVYKFGRAVLPFREYWN
ncbi:MAG: hypothetical protein IAF38_16815 [Bacteroidia bacterium]|nr:hypothetical protein [Bacteroidia bacterium]